MNTKIIRDIKRPSEEIVSLFKTIGTPTIDESTGRRGAMDSSIKPIWRGMKCCGTALTVKCHVGDNLTLLKAIDLAQPGDVLVVDFGNNSEVSPWGEIAATACLEKGIAGLVINSSVRDIDELKKVSFPVFALGSCMKGTTKNYFGFINHPITCGGMTVNPGDIVVGDNDGVVVVKQEEAPEVLRKSKERDDKEANILKQLKQGKSLLKLLGYDKKIKEMGIE